MNMKKTKKKTKASKIADAERKREARMERLAEAHAEYARKHGAEFYNFGWGTDYVDESIASKTSKGIVVSYYTSPRKIRHYIATC